MDYGNFRFLYCVCCDGTKIWFGILSSRVDITGPWQRLLAIHGETDGLLMRSVRYPRWHGQSVLISRQGFAIQLTTERTTYATLMRSTG